MGEIAKVIEVRKVVADEKIAGSGRDFFRPDDFDLDVGEEEDDPNHVLDDEIATRFRLRDGLLQIDEERDKPAIGHEEGKKSEPIKNGQRERDEKSPKIRRPAREIIGEAAEGKAQGDEEEKKNHDYYFPLEGGKKHPFVCFS